MFTSIVIRVALVGAIFGASVSARSDEERPRRPPQAAFDACQSKSTGDTCTVTFGESSVTGTCATTPEGTLACRPEHPPGPPPDRDHAEPPR